MENKDLNTDIINYLYGEMSEEERKTFEAKLKTNPTLKAEVDALRGVRTTMGELQDREPALPAADTTSEPNSTIAINWIKPLLYIAASLALLITAGYFTNFTIRQNEAGLFIGFTTSSPDKYIKKSEVESMIHDALAQQQEVYEGRLSANRDSLKQYISNLAPTRNTQHKLPANVVSEGELTRQINQLQSGQMALFQKYIEMLNEQQQDYLQEALVQFSDYMQEQREEDLITIQRNLNELKTYQDQHKQATNQLLADIIATVSDQK